MAARNDITGDAIVTKALSKAYEENFDSIFPLKVIEDRDGNKVQVCSRRCWAELEFGKVVCKKPHCDHIIGKGF